MKHVHFIFFIMICILFTGCNKKLGSNTDRLSEIYTIDFEQGFNTEQQMFISEIADSIEYIELKTPDDIVVTRIWDIMPVDEYLIIKARVDVYLFHRNGQFIRQIGARGQGPGEYTVPCDMDFDKKNKEIIIADTKQFLFYDLKGNFLRSKKKEVNIPFIGISDSILWIGTETTSGDLEYKAVAISLQGYGDTLAHLLNPFYGTVSGRGGAGNPRSRFFYHEKDYLYFIGDMSNDTIWRLSGVSAEPYAFVDMGKYKLPIEFEPWYSSWEVYRQNTKNDKYWCVSSITENEHYFFIFSHHRNDSRNQRKSDAAFAKYIVYDKETGKSFSVKDNNGIGFTDDFLEGPPIWPHFTSDDYFIDWIETHVLLEMIEAGEYTPAPQLEELLSRIDDYSNDIVILIHRKNNEY